MFNKKLLFFSRFTIRGHENYFGCKFQLKKYIFLTSSDISNKISFKQWRNYIYSTDCWGQPSRSFFFVVSELKIEWDYIFFAATKELKFIGLTPSLRKSRIWSSGFFSICGIVKNIYIHKNNVTLHKELSKH